MTESGREIARNAVIAVTNHLGQAVGTILSYEATLHDRKYLNVLASLKRMVAQVEVMQAELNTIANTLEDCRHE